MILPHYHIEFNVPFMHTVALWNKMGPTSKVGDFPLKTWHISGGIHVNLYDCNSSSQLSQHVGLLIAIKAPAH